jgi:hypothetical protein
MAGEATEVVKNSQSAALESMLDFLHVGNVGLD